MALFRTSPSRDRAFLPAHCGAFTLAAMLEFGLGNYFFTMESTKHSYQSITLSISFQA
jgi:hypothetical protein